MQTHASSFFCFLYLVKLVFIGHIGCKPRILFEECGVRRKRTYAEEDNIPRSEESKMSCDENMSELSHDPNSTTIPTSSTDSLHFAARSLHKPRFGGR